ncbi:MAG: MarR family transcriptional regulator [Oscillospiraceae bacterium]|nr:MarR family transcriptional regulator [Oscillospiraceae bacterium]
MINRYGRFSNAIACIYHDIQRIERVEMARYGLKGPHAQCLLEMGNFPDGVTAARLCESCEKDKAAISRILTELEQAGMILREKRNGIAYRAKLYLTQRGSAAAQSVAEKAQLAVELAGAGLKDSERETFYFVLEKIAGNLHGICRDGLNKREG